MRPIDDFYKLKDFTPTEKQREAIDTTDGAVLIIAGPGSGKTRVLLWRAFHLIVYKKVEPKNILLCTFTEKAADQLRLGLENLIDLVEPDQRDKINLSQMPIGTIHSICATFLRENVRDWRLSMKNFVVLDEITQMLFVYDNENFQRIKGNELYFNRTVNERSNSRTRCVTNLLAYFNKLTEETIRPTDIIESGVDERLKVIAPDLKYPECREYMCYWFPTRIQKRNNRKPARRKWILPDHRRQQMQDWMDQEYRESDRARSRL